MNWIVHVDPYLVKTEQNAKKPEIMTPEPIYPPCTSHLDRSRWVAVVVYL